MNKEIFTMPSAQDVPLDPVDSEDIESSVNEDVRKRGNKWCAYVDDKLTKAEKEANPKRHKGKKRNNTSGEQRRGGGGGGGGGREGRERLKTRRMKRTKKRTR